MALVVVAVFSACIRGRRSEKPFDVNLYSGIQDLAKIDDSEPKLLERAKAWSYEVSETPRDIAEDRNRLVFPKVFHFKDVGMRVYLRQGRVALIELQEPFRGVIQGKKLQVFSFAAPEGTSWEDALVREFGSPTVRASGGRFGAESFFYSWGDVSFNRMGPNQLAIYRDKDISNFRQKSFGRDVKFFE